jgi:tetratricopeptide (TPR) repeat protein
MRFVVYLIVFGFLFVSCAGNRDEQTSGGPEISPVGQTDENISDTSFILPDEIAENDSLKNEVAQKDSIIEGEEEKHAQQEFVPTLDARDEDDTFKNTMEYHYKHGLVLFKINKFEEGIKAFDTAIAMDPGKSGSYINRGKGFMELKRYEAARRDFEKAVNLDPRDTTSYLYLAMAHYQLGNYQEAVEANTEVIILAPQKAKGYYNRGIAYGLLRDYESAIADFNQAIALNPEYAEAFFNRGLAYYFMGDKKAACEDWEMAKYFGNQKAVGAVEKYCK